jgi:hypothetical protein
MSLINLDFTLDPQHPWLEFDISMTPQKLTVNRGAMQSFSVHVSGAGSIGGELLTPLYGKIQDAIHDSIVQLIQGLPGSSDITFDHPLGYTLTVEGVDVKVDVSTINLSTYQGMLMASGTLDVE